MTKEISPSLGNNNPQTNKLFKLAIILFIISALSFFSTLAYWRRYDPMGC